MTIKSYFNFVFWFKKIYHLIPTFVVQMDNKVESQIRDLMKENIEEYIYSPYMKSNSQNTPKCKNIGSDIGSIFEQTLVMLLWALCLTRPLVWTSSSVFALPKFNKNLAKSV